jgi:hypothetical protein
MGIQTARRVGLFDSESQELNDSQVTAILALVGAGLAVIATIVTGLLAKHHNDRAEERLMLDTVVKSLELVSSGENYTPSAKLAGGITTLVHTGHPIIAIRTLSEAWRQEKVGADTASWLINEVYLTGSDTSKLEASMLLYEHADGLTQPLSPGLNFIPRCMERRWYMGLPTDARVTNLAVLARTLVSQDPEWWWGHNGISLVLIEAMYKDPDKRVRADAAVLVLTLFADTALAPVVYRRANRLAEKNPHLNFSEDDPAIQRFGAWKQKEAEFRHKVAPKLRLAPPRCWRGRLDRISEAVDARIRPTSSPSPR